jgi:hypothetical protein
MVNGFFFFFAVCLLSLGIWMNVDASFKTLAGVKNLGAPEPFIVTAGAVLITIGTLSLIISLFGLCGAIRSNEECVFFYVVILLILLTGELTASMMIGLFREELQTGFEKTLQTYFMEDYVPNNTKFYSTWNFVMYNFDCCGSQDFNDFGNGSKWYMSIKPELEKNATKKAGKDITYYVPEICCYPPKTGKINVNNFTAGNFTACMIEANEFMNSTKTDGKYLHGNGCYQSLINWLDTNLYAPIIILVFVGAVQLTGLISGCLFRRQVLDVALGELQYYNQNRGMITKNDLEAGR